MDRLSVCLPEVLQRIVERILLRYAKACNGLSRVLLRIPNFARPTGLAGLRDSRRVELGTDTVTILVSVTRPLKSAGLSIMYLVKILQPAVENV